MRIATMILGVLAAGCAAKEVGMHAESEGLLRHVVLFKFKEDAPAEEDTQVMERVDEDDTEILRRPGPLSENYLVSGEDRDR